MQGLEIHTDPGVDTHGLVQKGRGERAGSQLQHPLHQQKHSSWGHSISCNVGSMNLKQRNSVLRFTLSPEERGQKERISCFHFTQLNRTNTRIAQLKTGPEHHILEKDRDAGST